MSAWFVVWLVTLAFAWLVIDEVGWWWRLTDDNLQRTVDAWRATLEDLEAEQRAWRRAMDDLEAAQRRIAELEADREVIPGDEWKL